MCFYAYCTDVLTFFGLCIKFLLEAIRGPHNNFIQLCHYAYFACALCGLHILLVLTKMHHFLLQSNVLVHCCDKPAFFVSHNIGLILHVLYTQVIWHAIMKTDSISSHLAVIHMIFSSSPVPQLYELFDKALLATLLFTMRDASSFGVEKVQTASLVSNIA